MLNWSDYIGELHIKDDSKPDEVTKLVAGDIIHIDYGTHNTLTTLTGAKRKFLFFSFKLLIWWILIPLSATVFGVSYAPSHLHPEDYVKKK